MRFIAPLLLLLLSLSSCEDPETLPLVKFGKIVSTFPRLEDRTETSAVCGGYIYSLDSGVVVTTRGVCWGTELNPTRLENKIEIEGGGKGEFLIQITGLKSGTSYHYRAYMISSKGLQYADDTVFYTYQPL